MIGCTAKHDSSATTGAPPRTAAAEAATPAAQPALPPVSLPDLSGATAAAARQLREQYAVLERERDDPATPPADLADSYGAMGQLLLAAEFRDSAAACFLAAQVLAPDDMRWPYFLGHLYRINGATGKAAAAFERALELKPGDGATLAWLGEVYLDQGRPEAAEPLFARALSIDRRAAAASWGLGRAALARRDFSRAVEYLEQTRALDPKASIVHYPLALAYRRLGRTGDADAHLRAKGDIEVTLADPLMDALASSVRSEFVLEHLGVRALNNRDFTAAASYFRQAIEMAPDEASFRHRLGTALALQGDVNRAVTEFQAVLRRSPNFASTHYALGVLIAASGHYDDAITQFSAAVKSNPGYVEARLQLADTLRRSGKLAESLAHYEQVARLDPRVADAALGLAMALTGLGRYQEASDRLAAAMQIHPTRPAFAHGLVRLYAAAADERLRDGNRALTMARDLVAREQPTADLAEAMAMALAETGQYEDAVTWQREAVSLAARSGRADLSQRMAENLALFARHQASRRPWRVDDPAEASNASGAF
ncbi:MAG: tetratricopeptide repeat protein [Acidobacteriota bacterium]